MKILWRKIIIAGVAGLACGHIYRHVREHSTIPPVAWPILQGSLAAGVCGSALGLAVAAYKNIPSHVYVLSVGANFAVTSATFLVIREGVLLSMHKSEAKQLLHSDTTDVGVSSGEYTASSISGGTTGALVSILSRYGLGSVLLTSCGGVILGIAGQCAYDSVQRWRKQKAIELYYPELVPSHQDSKPRWSLDSFQQRFLGFWHQYSLSAQLEDRHTMLKATIEEERTKIAELDELLELQNSSHK